MQKTGCVCASIQIFIVIKNSCSIYLSCLFSDVQVCKCCSHLCCAWFFWNNVDWAFSQTKQIFWLYLPWLSDTLSFHWLNKTEIFYTWRKFFCLSLNYASQKEPISWWISSTHAFLMYFFCSFGLELTLPELRAHPSDNCPLTTNPATSVLDQQYGQCLSYWVMFKHTQKGTAWLLWYVDTEGMSWSSESIYMCTRGFLYVQRKILCVKTGLSLVIGWMTWGSSTQETLCARRVWCISPTCTTGYH